MSGSSPSSEPGPRGPGWGAGTRPAGPHPGSLSPLRRAAVSVDPFYEMLAARKKRISVKKKQEQA